jgi:hypothetical protein
MIRLLVCTRIVLLLLAAGLLFTPALAGDEKERVPGTITLSDGTVLEGAIRTTVGKPLRLFETSGQRRLDLRLPDIHRITVHVVHEEQHRVWRWVEDGSREKVYTGETYPKREYEVEVVLRNGLVHRGHMVAVLYVYEEGRKKPRKVILKQKEQHGQVGKKRTDLVYVGSVQIDGHPPEESASTGIRLAVIPQDLVLTAHALAREWDRPEEATNALIAGRMSFTSLLPGTYDLAVVTEENIYLRLAVGEKGGEPVRGELLETLRKRVAEIADFFEEREVLAAVHEGDRMRALVFKSRRGPTSMGGQRVFRRFEIWSLHKGGDRWLVDHRAYLWREHGEELPERMGFVLTDSLGGVRVDTGIVEVEFEVPGKDER